jgi:UPF0755 protein
MIRRLPILVVLAVLIALALGWSRWTARAPADAPTVTLTVPTGASLPGVARRLEAAHLVPSARLFTLAARALGSAKPIQAGEYALPKGAGWRQLLSLLQSGRVIQHLITIPEGLPSVLVADRLAAEPLLQGPIPLPPEGRVLPDTYAFQRGEFRTAVLARMTAAMDRTLAHAWAGRARTTPVHTPEQALTLASIIEKETALAAERPFVAGVYANRLRLGMKLDADPTVIYPITQGRPLGRPIRQSDLHADTGYNTYLKPGLPKGPIANPGRLSILAALHPAPTPALYFVANGHGGHIFADTLAEQARNVARWRALGH